MTNEVIVPKSPMVDLTSVVGIESLFHKGSTDPWASEMAGDFTDLFIWNDQVRYILPVPSGKEKYIPLLFKQLLSREEKVLEPKEYTVSDAPTLDPEYLELFFREFFNWVSDKKRTKLFRRWIALHYEPRIRSNHIDWIGRDRFYNVEALKGLHIFKDAVSNLKVGPERLLYAFDVSLRYPYYGELAGQTSPFFAHPIRSGPRYSKLEREQGPELQFPISFKPTAKELAHRMKQDEFTVFLHNARHLVRHHKLIGKKRGDVDRETCREIAQKLHLPARLKKTTTFKIVATSTGLITLTTAAAPVITPVASVALGVTTIATAFWDRHVPPIATEIRWLYPHIEWDLEKQAMNRKAASRKSPSHGKGFYSFINLLNIMSPETG